jgi:hypothetical protein
LPNASRACARPRRSRRSPSGKPRTPRARSAEGARRQAGVAVRLLQHDRRCRATRQ